jgi:hypothetical protein
VPVSSLLIIISALVPLTFPLVHLSGLFASIVGFLSWLTEYLTEKAGGLPFASISNIGVTLPEFILLTFCMFLLSWYIFKKPRISILLPATAFLFFLLSCSARYFCVSKTSELIVYNTYNDVAIGIRDGHRLALFTLKDTIPGEVTRHSSVAGLTIDHKTLTDSTLYISNGSGLLMIAPKYDPLSRIPVQTKYIIYTSSSPFPDKLLSPEFPEGAVVITYGNYRYRPPGGKNADYVSYWQIKKSGAYCKSL